MQGQDLKLSAARLCADVGGCFAVLRVVFDCFQPKVGGIRRGSVRLFQ